MPTDALITQSLGSLINGISRQPAQQRLPSQAELQDNYVSEVATGVARRPPTEHQAILTGLGVSLPALGYKYHTIDLGPGKRFRVFVEDGDIHVYNLETGAVQAVADASTGSPGSYTYLNANGRQAQEVFELVTVADYTFIVNRSITTALSPLASPGRDHATEFFIHITGRANSVTDTSLEIDFAGTTINTGNAATNKVLAIATRICNALTGIPNPDDAVGTAVGSENWRFTRVEDTLIHGYQFQGTPEEIDINADDGFETFYTFVSTGVNGEDPAVSRFTDLPKRGVENFTAKVKGGDGNSDDDFYVVYREEERVWKETVKPGLVDAFDADTMPHALVYNHQTGNFSFESITWAQRSVGDTESAPVPSFVGNTLSHLVLHKNRMTFLADENTVLSESGEFFNFWPTTVTTLVDSDPIDTAGTGDRVSIWDYAIPFRGGLTLFSATGDAISELVGSRDAPLTIQNARIDERGVYAHSQIKPVAAADSIYYLLDRGGSTRVYQYQQTDVDVWDSNEITSHVDAYVPGNISQMSVGHAESILSLLTDNPGQRNKAYIFRWFFLGDRQVMSSWSEWTFGATDEILHMDWVESVLYLNILRSDGVHLEKIDFGKIDEDEGGPATPLGHRVHLDSLLSLTGTYDSAAGTTSWTIPYDQFTEGGEYQVVRGGAWGNRSGSVIGALVNETDGTLSAPGNHTAFPVYIGRRYQSAYEFSQFVMRNTSNERGVEGARTSGRLQLRQGRVLYNRTGTFDAYVTSTEDDDIYGETFTSQYVNQAIAGRSALDDGLFEFHIGGDSRNVRVRLESNSFLPAAFASFEFDARFYQRTTQVG